MLAGCVSDVTCTVRQNTMSGYCQIKRSISVSATATAADAATSETSKRKHTRPFADLYSLKSNRKSQRMQ